jgi:His-Xaa-Ser system protein HxsD
MKTVIDQKNNAITFEVSSKIYAKEIVYKACYVFIDKLYIFLAPTEKKDAITVTLRGKDALTKKGLEKLEGEFVNELLNCLVRENVSKRNQKVLEQIVGGAMGAALGMGEANSGGDKNEEAETENNIGDEDSEIEAAIATLRKELEAIETEDNYEEDTLGIREITLDPVETKPAKVTTSKKNKQPKKKTNVRKK